MTAPGDGRSGGPAAPPTSGSQASGGDSAQRFGVATPGTSPPAGRSRVRAGEQAQEPAQPQGRWQRLPRWKQVMVFVVAGILLIGGGFLIGWLTMGANVRALRVANELHAGAQFTAQDLEVVGVGKDFEGLVPAGQMRDIVGQTARTNLPAGTLLRQDQSVPQEGLPGSGQFLVPLQGLKPGQVPSGLSVGDLVAVVAPPPSNQQGGGFEPEVLTDNVPVWTIRAPSGGQSDTLRVTLLVGDRIAAQRLAAFSASGPVTVVRVGGEQR